MGNRVLDIKYNAGRHEQCDLAWHIGMFVTSAARGVMILVGIGMLFYFRRKKWF